MIYEELTALSYNQFIKKNKTTKTKVILQLIDMEASSRGDLIQLISNPNFDRVSSSKIADVAMNYPGLKTTLREYSEKAFYPDAIKVADEMGVDVNSELFETILQLESEIKLYEMFGDVDTAKNLAKQLYMVGLLEEEHPDIVYLHASNGACEHCKRVHDQCRPFIRKFIQVFLTQITHPNCRCLIKDKPPIPGQYIQTQSTNLFDGLFQFIKNPKAFFKSLSFSDVAHGILDILGFIPVFGAIADGINAVYYLAEGDFLNASLSAVAAIPLVGYVGGTIKTINTGAKVIDKANDAIKIIDKVNDALKVADRIKDATKVIDRAGDIAKAIDKISDTSRFVNNITDYSKMFDKISDTIKTLDNIKDVKKVADSVLEVVKSFDKAILKFSKKSVKFAGTASDIAKGLDKVGDTRKIITEFSNSSNLSKNISSAINTTDKINDIIRKGNKVEEISKSIDKIGELSKGADRISDVTKLTDGTDVIRKMQKDVISQADDLQKIGRNDIISKRPTPRQSEIDFINNNPDFRGQVSFKNGEQVKYGTKNSSRIDAYKNGVSNEIKNYKLDNKQNAYNLLNTLKRQYFERIHNLPVGTKQIADIDIRGQNVSDDILEMIYNQLIKIYDEVRFIR